MPKKTILQYKKSHLSDVVEGASTAELAEEGG